eukprot:CAMPEP_0194160752 /NCGR_PEP_ID=MMETSP0152-20130528/78556_1 /TAXON_ID=1049557 /ORGANISM="Thalassiothrix antarctica, Strain L6-D1" /LENGTH=739 /DNA_ID=CAMNT_0038870467 /DNA_START=655 /DNA_END=2874 /DNA_ORIENTATION=-
MSSTTQGEEKSEEEKAALKAAREARKAEKERLKAEKKAKKAIEKAKKEEAERINPVTYLSVDNEEQYEPFGDYTRIMSRSESGRKFEHVVDIGSKHVVTGDKMWLRGRLQSIRVKGGSCFLVLRQDSFHTVQACFFKDKENPEQSQKMIRYLKTLTEESVIDVEGVLVDADVRSCSVQKYELSIHRIHSVSPASKVLPFSIEDAARPEDEVEASQDTERPFPRLGQDLRLNNRWMDLRVPANNAILRIQSAVCQLFRESLYAQDFVEIHTPKLVAGESESGAGVFTTVRGRLQSIRVKGGSCFLVLRQDSFHTVQACFFKDKENPEQSQKMIRYLKTLTEESVIDVEGVLVDADVRSCSVQKYELSIHRIHSVSPASKVLPFSIEDAARPEDEVEASQDTERPFPRLGQDLRLNNRWMDLRVPANNAILRIQSAVCQLFRESLYAQDFVEIHTPKLVAGESESGAGVFTTDYFGTTACLAQSPQLYKQMAIASDMNRVFEIGPVFRAEKSHTRRHLCEFTGLDLEMAIDDHYNEALEVVHNMFKHIFTGLENRFGKELAIIREQYASEAVAFTDKPCILHWPEAMQILREDDSKFDMGDEMNDLTGAMELALGQAVKEKYGTDFFILDKYPSAIRPFYTMPDPEDDKFSNSYDIFIRGQEICSGAQRCHDPDLVQQILKQKGIDDPGDGLKSYIESFKHGVSPHAGAGIGLERVVFLYLGLDNVRKASMFPRDPNRCTP